MAGAQRRQLEDDEPLRARQLEPGAKAAGRVVALFGGAAADDGADSVADAVALISFIVTACLSQ